MAIGNVSYTRSSVEFIEISSVKDIKKNNSIKLKWKINIKNKSDIVGLYLLRAVLNPYEAADLSKRSIKDKFKVIKKYELGDSDTIDGKVVFPCDRDGIGTFTDEFSWDGDSLHNLNINNDRTWNEVKFNKAITRIVSGEQGIYYKIYGYSRRMSRSATPIGFFCDGKNIVALSQRNQVINDKWYSEGGVVWKNGSSSAVVSGECFCRVVVDMNQDLGEKPRKCRRVWASTNKGRIVVFDYWTGRVIGTVAPNNKPVYAIGYSSPNDLFVYYDGNGNIRTVKEDPVSERLTVRSKSVSDFVVGEKGAKRVMGGVCASERNDAGVPTCYFYVISNREIVVKYKITANEVSKVSILDRTHFGCTNKHGSKTDNDYIGKTPANQNNIYGIGAGANGQVWANGHTPLTTLMYDIKDSGNPVIVYARLGRGADDGYTGGNNPKAKTKYPDLTDRKGCAGHPPTGNTTGASAVREAMLEYSPKMEIGGIEVNTDKTKIEDLVYRLNKHTLYKYHYNDEVRDRNSHNGISYDTWRYSAAMDGEDRPDSETDSDYLVGCKGGIKKDIGLKWVNKYIKGYNYLGKKIDQRVLGAGKKITEDSFEYVSKNRGPENPKVDRIQAIHQELVAVFDGNISYKNVSFLQDLNYVYGCTYNENINDTNGQMEDKQNFGSEDSDYRMKLQNQATSSVDYFSPTTKWIIGNAVQSYGTKYNGMYGYAGEPLIFDKEEKKYYTTGNNIHTYDAKVLKPHPYNVMTYRKDDVTKSELTAFFGRRIYNTHKDGDVYIDLDKYSASADLPMSIGSITPTIPYDGRMWVHKKNSIAYKVGAESNALSYNIAFADRREGKIGILSYSRASAANEADISYKQSTGRRLKYDKPSKNTAYKISSEWEYFPFVGAVSNTSEYLNKCPYHVTVDSDNNLWFSSPTAIGKLQLLANNSAGSMEKYVYDKTNGSGLHAFENNNTYFESSLILLEKHAKDGAKRGSHINPNGITNGTAGGAASAVYQAGQQMLDEGEFTLSKNDASNNAYVYNYAPWDSAITDGCWTHKTLFGLNNRACYNNIYNKTDKNYYLIGDDNESYRSGNIDNEYNSDNFGINSLFQMNRVEFGPDIIHPKILKPNADTRISRSVSTSHNDRCDTFDGQSYWDAKTRIFDNEHQTSGYDDLDTTHQIYNIVTNGRRLVNHRYEYHDRNVIENSIVLHPFELNSDYEVEYPDEIYDNSPDLVWLVPNYTSMVPPYEPLSSLSGLSPYSENQYWVDIYLEFAPSVYNFWIADQEGVYESVQVGTHRVHVFERWPTPDFCVRGIGNSESIDKTTDYDLVGQYFWGDCTNE